MNNPCFQFPAVIFAFSSLLSGCVMAPPVVSGPMMAAPIPPPPNLERANTGSLYKASSGSLYNGRRKPRAVGDMVKVNIVETISTSTAVKTDISRDSSFSSKGTGNASDNSPLSPWLNQNDKASGNNNFKGSGSNKNDNSFNGQIAASVITVLANGNLVIAGERIIATQGNGSAVRFSGVVDPKDIKDGNQVQSSDVVNARLEMVGQGDVSASSSRNWLQRVLSSSLAIW
nr:flagellar basal body L-ring protein FlgH [uncultured Rhodoferax sp.]